MSSSQHLRLVIDGSHTETTDAVIVALASTLGYDIQNSIYLVKDFPLTESAFTHYGEALSLVDTTLAGLTPPTGTTVSLEMDRTSTSWAF